MIKQRVDAIFGLAGLALAAQAFWLSGRLQLPVMKTTDQVPVIGIDMGQGGHRKIGSHHHPIR
jgi:hypothetical protein